MSRLSLMLPAAAMLLAGAVMVSTAQAAPSAGAPEAMKGAAAQSSDVALAGWSERYRHYRNHDGRDHDRGNHRWSWGRHNDRDGGDHRWGRHHDRDGGDHRWGRHHDGDGGDHRWGRHHDNDRGNHRWGRYNGRYDG